MRCGGLGGERQRELVAVVASQWRELRDEQRAGWHALAGQLPGQLSGCQAYQKVNVTRLGCGQSMAVAAPPPPRFGIIALLSLAIPTAAPRSAPWPGFGAPL